MIIIITIEDHASSAIFAHTSRSAVLNLNKNFVTEILDIKFLSLGKKINYLKLDCQSKYCEYVFRAELSAHNHESEARFKCWAYSTFLLIVIDQSLRKFLSGYFLRATMSIWMADTRAVTKTLTEHNFGRIFLKPIDPVRNDALNYSHIVIHPIIVEIIPHKIDFSTDISSKDQAADMNLKFNTGYFHDTILIEIQPGRSIDIREDNQHNKHSKYHKYDKYKKHNKHNKHDK
jgi:hypothetical protein